MRRRDRRNRVQEAARGCRLASGRMEAVTNAPTRTGTVPKAVAGGMYELTAKPKQLATRSIDFSVVSVPL
jgi:hypothetical protein